VPARLTPDRLAGLAVEEVQLAYFYPTGAVSPTAIVVRGSVLATMVASEWTSSASPTAM
jgi:hypothetical protein